jgi:Flp pilus assembly protein TadD
MHKIWPIFLFSAALMLSNCGSSNKQSEKGVAEQVIESEKGAELSEKEQQEKLVEAFEILDKRMKKMVATAKDGGPEAIEFLASDLFLKANDSSMRGDSHTAAYLYKQLLELKPTDYYVRKKYAVELIRLGSLVEAKLVLGDLLKESQYKEET